MWMLLVIGLGGAVGAIARYSLGLLFVGQTFPWGTLTINVAGSFSSVPCGVFVANKTGFKLGSRIPTGGHIRWIYHLFRVFFGNWCS